MGAALTGRAVKFHAIDMFRMRGGKAVEAWHQGDEMMALAQIGVKLPM